MSKQKCFNKNVLHYSDILVAAGSHHLFVVAALEDLKNVQQQKND